MSCEMTLELTIFLTESTVEYGKSLSSGSNIVFRKCNDPESNKNEYILFLKLNYKESLDLNDRIEDLYAAINSNIIKLVAEYNLQTKVDVVMKISEGDVPAFYLTREFINFLKKINCEIDFDLYIQ